MPKLLNRLVSKETRIILDKMDKAPEEFASSHFGDYDASNRAWVYILEYGSFPILDRLIMMYKHRQVKIQITKTRIYAELMSA
jgi:Cft2 family RNA processing exonuclease